MLRKALPGCDTLEFIEANRLAVQMVAKLGPVKARFQGEIQLTELRPPESYRLLAQGKGGVAGFARGSADVSLEERERDGNIETVMHYYVKATVGGKLAQIGSRLVQGAAKKMAGDFFTRFSKVIVEPERTGPATDV